MLLLRPLEVTATSKLGHFILTYRTSIVPSFIKIGDGDFQGVIDLTWTDPYIILIFRYKYSCFPSLFIFSYFSLIFLYLTTFFLITYKKQLQVTQYSRAWTRHRLIQQPRTLFYDIRQASACTFHHRMWPHFVLYTTLTNDL